MKFPKLKLKLKLIFQNFKFENEVESGFKPVKPVFQFKVENFFEL